MGIWESVGFDDPGAMPFFTDLQINGAGEVDLLSATSVDEIHRLGRELFAQGTIAYQPSLISASEEATIRAISLIESARREQREDEAEILGIHLEGPFLSASMAGAHPKEHLRLPDTKSISRYLSAGTITMVTIAPELPGAIELIRFIVSMGVKVSIGHSDANKEEARAAFAAGASFVTHIFNRCSQDLIEVALQESEANLMLIADGSHVSDERIAQVFETAGDRIVATTDSVSITGLNAQGLEIRDGAAFRVDGVKAGSIATMRALWERISRVVDQEAATMACATRPAALMGRAELGLLEFGYPAQRLA